MGAVDSSAETHRIGLTSNALRLLVFCSKIESGLSAIVGSVFMELDLAGKLVFFRTGFDHDFMIEPFDL